MFSLVIAPLIGLAACAAEVVPPPPAEVGPPPPPELLLLQPEETPVAPEALAPATFALGPQASGRSQINYSNLRVSFEIGQRTYTDSNWGSLDSQSAVGFTFAQEPPGYLVGWDAGIFWSSANGRSGALDIKVNTWELYGGVMKTLHLMPHRLHLELAAGAAMNYLYFSDRSTIGSPTSDSFFVSGYGRAGLNLRVGGSAWVGVGARAARGGNASVAGTNLDGDYDQLTFTLSSAW